MGVRWNKSLGCIVLLKKKKNQSRGLKGGGVGHLFVTESRRTAWLIQYNTYNTCSNSQGNFFPMKPHRETIGYSTPFKKLDQSF